MEELVEPGALDLGLHLIMTKETVPQAYRTNDEPCALSAALGGSGSALLGVQGCCAEEVGAQRQK